MSDGESTPFVPEMSTYSWGRYDNGLLLTPSLAEPSGSMVYIGKSFMEISSNLYTTCALLNTGELYITGQVDDNDEEVVYKKPRVLDILLTHKITSVSVGLHHVVVVNSNGCAISFGNNECGQLGHSPQIISHVPPRTVNFKCRGNKSAIVIKKALAGDLFTLLLTTSGDLYSCGAGDYAGLTGNVNLYAAEKIDSLTSINVAQIATGSSHSFALSNQNVLYGWGNNRHMQLGTDIGGDHAQIPILININNMQKYGSITNIACGYSHSLLNTENGYLLGCGSNKQGQLASTFPRVDTFQEISFSIEPNDRCIDVKCGSNHSLILVSNAGNRNKIFGFGSNTFNQITATSTVSMYRVAFDISQEIYNQNPRLENIIYLSGGGDQSFCIGYSRQEVSDTTSGSRSVEYGAAVNDNTFLQKKFSTRASKCQAPMSATSINRLLMKAKACVGQEDEKAINNIALTTFCEIISNPALLGGSFFQDTVKSSTHQALYGLDVVGLEECYSRILLHNSSALPRILLAMQTIIVELEDANISNSKIGSHFPESIIRVFLILWQCPLNLTPTLTKDLFIRLIKLVLSFSSGRKVAWMEEAMAVYPTHLFVTRLLNPLHEHLSFILDNENIEESQPNMCIYADMLRIIYDANMLRQYISNDLLYNTTLSAKNENILFQNYSKFAPSTSFSPLKYSFLISADAKRRMLQIESAIKQQHHVQASMQQHSVFANGLITARNLPYFVLFVDRANLLQCTLNTISNVPEIELRKPLKVVFQNEEGIDEGGVRKEFFQLLIANLFDLNFGMFVAIMDGRSIWFNASNTYAVDEYHLIGILLGLAVYNHTLLNIHMPMVFYKKLLNLSTDMSDLEHFDPQLARGLQQLLEYSPAEDVEDIFCRTFTYEYENSYGTKENVELIENGNNVYVTGENRELYVQKLTQYLLHDSVEQQFAQLKSGFFKVVGSSILLECMRPDELELLMVGSQQLDFQALETRCEYIGEANWNKDHPTVKYFWEVVHNTLDFEEKQKLLEFVTGSSRAPIGGLGNLGLKIQRAGPDSDNLPTSHTCFNTLLLPEYSTKEKMQNRLTLALSECKGFGLK